MSSIASSVAELTRRVSAMFDEASRAGQDTLAADLAIVERSLLAAQRKLEACAGR